MKTISDKIAEYVAFLDSTNATFIISSVLTLLISIILILTQNPILLVLLTFAILFIGINAVITTYELKIQLINKVSNSLITTIVDATDVTEEDVEKILKKTLDRMKKEIEEEIEER